MKKLPLLVLLASATHSFAQFTNYTTPVVMHEEAERRTMPVVEDILPKGITPVHNVFVITLDGFRWEDLFNGADSDLINNEKFTPANEPIKAMYWAATPEERRKKLMPFFWNVMVPAGQVYGNRLYNNKMNVYNAFAKSYPGYNEIFTGETDPNISSNKKIENENINVLEYLNSRPGLQDKVAAFTSWDVFPYILNKNRSGLMINSGYDTMIGSKLSRSQMLINKTEDKYVFEKSETRYDQLTFLVAKEYLREHQPRVLYLGLGETDEFGHQGRYDLYLEQINQIDKMLAHLWHLVQTTPGYANNTSFVITTDHGRGRKKSWTSHGQFIKGSDQTWLAVVGPGIPALGEMKDKHQGYQFQIAPLIAQLLGEEFKQEEYRADN